MRCNSNNDTKINVVSIESVDTGILSGSISATVNNQIFQFNTPLSEISTINNIDVSVLYTNNRNFN